ncbi:translation initiation factor IF-2 N-terminal domain-containing protein, partial [bacterium]|nr:translation initiation factor IF-2 N-terminal domain-containing protein [bacterium]
MAAKRIYQAARELDLTSKALVQLLRELGFEVKSHMSVFTEEMAQKVQQRLKAEQEEIRKREEEKQKIQQKAAKKERRRKEKFEKKRRRRKKKKPKG